MNHLPTMKKNVNESLDKMKYLIEFHFKPHGRNDSPIPSPVADEMPVKFNEVGDTYKYQEEEHDYPSYESYRNDVILDEEDPEPEQPQGQQPQNVPAPEPTPTPAPQSSPAPTPAGQEPPAPMPDASAAPAPAPMPEPAPMPPPPVAPPMPEPVPAAPVDPMMGTLAAQIAKTDELLAKFDDFQSKMAGMETVSLKLSDVEQKLEDLKNPPYDEQLEMISKKAYPYNIKLSDFWGWDKDDSSEEEPEQEFKMTPDDITNYNKEDIKKSFNV